MHINLTDTVTLKCKAGSFEFSTKGVEIHPESKKPYWAHIVYKFDADHDFRAAVPKRKWDELKDQMVSRTTGLRYKDILIEL